MISDSLFSLPPPALEFLFERTILDALYKWNHGVFVFLACLAHHNILEVHPCCRI